MKHPPLSPFRIADFAPNFEFGSNLNGKSSTLKDPDCTMVLGGPFAQIYPVGFQAHITRNWQAAHGTYWIRTRSAIDHRTERGHDKTSAITNLFPVKPHVVQYKEHGSSHDRVRFFVVVLRSPMRW